MTPGIILGCDFLSRNQLGISWGPEGTLQLRDEQDPSIQTAEEITNPTVKLAAKTVIPPRTLVLVTVSTTLPPCEEKTRFDFVPIQMNFHLGPNCIVYPLDYASIKGGLQRGLQILINLGQQDVKLQQGIVLGHYQKAPSEDIMITQEDIFGVNIGEPWCPFGLTQAPAYFQMLVNKVLEGLEFTFGYLDDILVFSKNMEEHLQHVRTLFERLHQADLKLTKRKCNFLKAHVQYLGHYISGQGLEPIPEKLQSLQEMPPPTDLTETRKFLGFVGYYRKFIPKYSDIAHPLTNLTRKDIPFEWSKACQAAFEMLKEYLLKEPILKYPKPDQPYVLYTDASKYAWAGVLTQAYVYKEEGKEFSIHHPITYVSGLFKGPQLNWAALTKEAYAIYMVARKLDYYLREAETTIRSDHLPLKSFLLKNTKNDKVNNWGVELASKYTLNFEYVKGVKNTLADTMSRLVTLDPDIILVKEPEGYQFGKQIGLNGDVTETEVKLISLAPVTPVSKSGKPVDPIPDKDILQWGISPEEIIQRQKADKFCQSIRDRITKAGSHVVHPYYLEEELLMRYVEDNKQRFEVIVIPWDLSKVVLKLAHDDLGHNGSA